MSETRGLRCERRHRRTASDFRRMTGPRGHPLAGRARRAGRSPARHRHRRRSNAASRTSRASRRSMTSSTGPHGPGAGRACTGMTAAAPTGRALVWVHGGAFIGGSLDMPESELGRPRARCPRHPGRRGRLREVPGRRALSRCRPTTCSPRGGTCATPAVELLGHPARAARPRRSECRRGADGGRSSTAPGRGRAAACRSPPGLHPLHPPEWPGRLSTLVDPASTHGQPR